MTAASLRRKVRRVADDRGDTFNPGYSGRGMYGKYCVGIETENANDVIAEVGLPGARTDSLGQYTIVYWPAIPADPKDT